MWQFVAVLVSLLPWSVGIAMAQTSHATHELIEDSRLTLAAIIDAASDRYPQAVTLEPLQQEAAALSALASNPLAGPMAVALRYQRDLPGWRSGPAWIRGRIRVAPEAIRTEPGAAAARANRTFDLG